VSSHRTPVAVTSSLGTVNIRHGNPFRDHTWNDPWKLRTRSSRTSSSPYTHTSGSFVTSHVTAHAVATERVNSLIAPLTRAVAPTGLATTSSHNDTPHRGWACVSFDTRKRSTDLCSYSHRWKHSHLCARQAYSLPWHSQVWYEVFHAQLGPLQ